MYTQCPDCDVAFRVTADILRQAAGKVRCGNCGRAFNAIEFLSEHKPLRYAGGDSQADLPELTPDSGDDDAAGSRRRPISAEQSAALLKTLDELAGDDIRIEDTGIEWQVLAAEDAADTPLTDTGSLRFVFADDEPTDDAGSEQSSDDCAADAESAEEEPQVELALGDAEEWQDLLSEVETSSPADAADDLAAPVVEAADAVPDTDVQFALRAEAVGLDLSGSFAAIDEEEDIDEEESPAPDQRETVQEVSLDEMENKLRARLEDAGSDASKSDPSPQHAVSDDGPDTNERSDAAESHERETNDVDEPTPTDDSMLTVSEEHRDVETIVMEGEAVRAEPDESEDDSLSMPILPVAERNRARPVSLATIAGITGLVLLLGLQYVHYSRESLATVSWMQRVIGPVYRALGQPITPAWELGAWRFEATRGSADEAGDVLTILTRIGNTSAKALPLPLVHVALTDRYEETLGARVLAPDEYLAGDADPWQAVGPGESFDAVISIDQPSSSASGYRLNVCYRLGAKRLKCAIEAFR